MSDSADATVTKDKDEASESSRDDASKPSAPPENLPPRPPPKEKGPPGPPPKPAMRKKAPGVKGSRQAPKQTKLETGDRVGGRFVVERYLGSSGGGISYLCNDTETQNPVVVKVLTMPYPGDEKFKNLRAQIGVATSIDHDNLTAAVGMGRTNAGDIFIAMEYVEGSTLSQLVSERREAGRTLSLRDTFTVLAHTCDALDVVHRRDTCHGVLTPYNIYVTPDGGVKVGNLAFGRVVSTYLHTKNKGPFVDSIYVAPEAAANPKALTRRSDLYSMGMIAAELLSPTGLPGDRKEAHDMAVDALAKYPPALFSLISGALSEAPKRRPSSVMEFRDEFEEIARDAGAKLEGPPPSGALPIQPAVTAEQGEEDDDDLFDMFDGELEGPASSGSEERYLVQKDGLDYGPFTDEEVLEQLYADEIDEFTPVMDRTTQERKDLQDIDVFRDRVLAYIPEREERLRREAERREELKRKAKKGGVAGLVVAIFVGLGVLGAMIVAWVQRPAPEPLPLDRAFASMDYHFSPPPTEFQTMEVDSDVLEGIFNPEATEEEIARQIAQAQSASPSAADSGASEAPAEEEERVAEVDLGADGGTDHHLSDYEINQVIMDEWPALRDCVMKEARQDASFRGVTVKFFIRPSGTTGGVGLAEQRYQNRPVGQCLIEEFRNMRFPEHGAVHERGVEFPLMVQ